MTNQLYRTGPIFLQYGGHLPDAYLSYKTFGTLNAAKDNVVLFPTWCAGTHRDVEWIIGPGRALDPARQFIVAIDMFGNGMSSSPSNTPAPFDRTRFPRVSILDNVTQQRRLLREIFGIERIKLVVGRSMGAQIAFQWGSYFADEVECILPMCGSARTSPHNYIFLATMKMAVKSSPDWLSGDYQGNALGSLQQFWLNADAWGFSQAYYRQGLHLTEKYQKTQDYLDRPLPEKWVDANDLLAQFATWEVADISDNDKFNKDFPAALRAITAKAIVMPSRTDMYFPPEDSEIEVRSMPDAELRVIPSIWGHRASSPGSDPCDIQFFEKAITDLLEARMDVKNEAATV
ncbi:alpha/beta fold hydrolase [Rhizobium sp. CF142]|uniref:alpha/beta fold hydrolase n=1 Tax=Rhizobium sp. CF142 TaxID=1144314 RepID=UPI00026EE94A|nr:alpha/beta fold hydrolase [Rhizobium sp. CF142]EJJ31480.1 homoserine acetyltransferase [Rhizobium sp. CF142]